MGALPVPSKTAGRGPVLVAGLLGSGGLLAAVLEFVEGLSLKDPREEVAREVAGLDEDVDVDVRLSVRYGLLWSVLNLHNTYFSLTNCSTALLSSSPSNGKGTFCGFQSIRFRLFPPLSAISSKSRVDHRSIVRERTSE